VADLIGGTGPGWIWPANQGLETEVSPDASPAVEATRNLLVYVTSRVRSLWATPTVRSGARWVFSRTLRLPPIMFFAADPRLPTDSVVELQTAYGFSDTQGQQHQIVLFKCSLFFGDCQAHNCISLLGNRPPRTLVGESQRPENRSYEARINQLLTIRS
jgi:hypothetical protein